MSTLMFSAADLTTMLIWCNRHQMRSTLFSVHATMKVTRLPRRPVIVLSPSEDMPITLAHELAYNMSRNLVNMLKMITVMCRSNMGIMTSAVWASYRGSRCEDAGQRTTSHGGCCRHQPATWPTGNHYRACRRSATKRRRQGCGCIVRWSGR